MTLNCSNVGVEKLRGSILGYEKEIHFLVLPMLRVVLSNCQRLIYY